MVEWLHYGQAQVNQNNIIFEVINANLRRNSFRNVEILATTCIFATIQGKFEAY